MDRRSFLTLAAVAPFARIEELEVANHAAPLEMGDVVYASEKRWGDMDEGLAMVTDRAEHGDYVSYSVRRMPGSRLYKSAWWQRSDLVLVERGAYYRALSREEK